MVEQVRSQLHMMLLQQSGMGSLPLSNLGPDEFLGFLRQVEQFVLQGSYSPIMVYWSSQNAQRLLPAGPALRELQRDAFCLCVFSEGRSDLADEWCVIIESPQLSLVVYGQQAADSDTGISFECVGSMDPQVVREAFNKMLPIWQFVDVPECNRLEDSRRNLGQTGSAPELINQCRAFWPVVKSPSADSFAEGHQHPQAPTRRDAPAPFPGGSPPGLVTMPAPVAASQPATAAISVSAQQFADMSEEVFPVKAQTIIKDIIGQLRHTNDLNAILQLTIERLTNATRAHRGLIWQIVGDQLECTNEFSSSGHTCFLGNQLSSQESTAVVLECLYRLPDESGAGVIEVTDTLKDLRLRKLSPTMTSLTELGEVRARLIAQLKCRGFFSGFVELQNCRQTRQWSEEDAAVVQSIAEMLSVVLQQSLDQSKIALNAEEMKLINEISSLFRESKGLKSHDVLVKSVQLVTEHMGFVHSQIYLINQEEERLIPHIENVEHEPVALNARDNPFIEVYESSHVKVVNAEYTRKGHPLFGHETAMIIPLISEGERLGVIGLWQRLPNRAQLRPQDKELALTIAGQLASIIRADQAVAQIRADQARDALINKVSNEIRQSLKEANEIMGTLVESLKDHFDLGLCVVSLYDNDAFTKSRKAGPLCDSPECPPDLAEQLFSGCLAQLKQGHTIFLTAAEIGHFQIPLGPVIKSATLVPLVHGGNFKAALLMVSAERQRQFPEKDRKMVADLADRVAVVISHAELFAQVERQAVTDPMTGLYNRRHFAEEMSKEMDRYQRFKRPFSYIIVDLDYLKKINDGLGHQYGDAAIKHIAAVLKKSVRDVDTAARYGGEEFVVLLPETDVPSARIAAERICAAIRQSPVEGVGTITASIGVSTFPVDADDRDKLTEMADQALYLAKHRGRNQVCSVSQDLLPSLQERGEEALEVQKQAIKAKVEELGAIDLKLFAEHGLLGLMGAVVKMIEARDAYENDRSPKAAEYATKLAQALRLSQDHITIISLAAVLQNVGKAALPEQILQKKGPLTPEERKVIEQSPTIGAKILEPARHLHRVAAVIESYHEHWDGSGYPKGLKAESIPLESRIIALVDAYIAMTSDRPYRKALSHDEALKLIQEGAGKEWDPRLVKLFVNLLKKDGA